MIIDVKIWVEIEETKNYAVCVFVKAEDTVQLGLKFDTYFLSRVRGVSLSI